MLRRLRERQEGFTLIELLIVIVILGILAAVVVFAVNGINNRGQASACTTDAKTLKTAEEAYFAQNSLYANEKTLQTGGFIAEPSTYDDVTVGATTAAATTANDVTTNGVTGAAYVVKYALLACGTVGSPVP